MLYQKAVIKNGRVKVVESKEVDQSKLTSECWPVQIGGLSACERCEFLGSADCGGKKIRMRLLKASK